MVSADPWEDRRLKPGAQVAGVHHAPMSVTSINSTVEAAVTAYESGDLDTAITKLSTAAIYLAAKPDTDFDGEKLIWNREAVQSMIQEIKRQRASQRGHVQVPVIRQLSTRRGCQ